MTASRPLSLPYVYSFSEYSLLLIFCSYQDGLTHRLISQIWTYYTNIIKSLGPPRVFLQTSYCCMSPVTTMSYTRLFFYCIFLCIKVILTLVS